MSINQVAISGNVARDAKLTETVNGSFVLHFTVAVNDRRKSKEGQWEDYASFIDCTMFGKRANAIAPYITKGTKVSIQGKLSQDRWQSNGETKSKIEVYVDEIELMSRRDRPSGDTMQKTEVYSTADVPF